MVIDFNNIDPRLFNQYASYFNALQEEEKKKQEQESGGGFSDWTPAIGSILGGMGGFAVGGPVGGVAGAAGGGALGEALRQRMEGEETNYGGIAKEAAYGGAGEVIGLGIGRLALPAISKVVGKGATKVADDLAIRGVRATPSKLTNYAEKFGEDLAKTLRRYGAEGMSSEDIYTKVVKPLQNQFDDIVKSSDIKVSRDVLDKNFYNKIEKLLNSGDLDDIKVAESILNQYDNILKETDGTLKSLNKLRSNFDLKYSNYKGNNPIKAGEKQVIADALRDSVREGAEAAGFDNVADIGRELSKFYDKDGILKIARAGENKGRGSLPLGLYQLLGGTLGGVVGSAGGPAGSGIGAVAGTMAAEKVINNPRLLKLLSKMASKAGRSIPTGATSNFISTPLGQGIARSLNTGPTGNEESASVEGMNINSSFNNNSGMDIQDAESQMSQDQYRMKRLEEAMFEDLKRTGGKNVAKLSAVYDILGSKGGGGLELSDTAIKKVSETQNALTNLNSLEQAISKNAQYMGPVARLQAISPYSGARELQAEIDRVRQVVGKAIEGGVLRKEDEEKYKKILPQLNDTPKLARAKINQLKSMISQDLENYINLQSSFGGSVQETLPADPTALQLGY